jgi:cell division transport system ATP-binding protein
VIHFDKVSKIYSDESVALDGVTFSVGSQEFVTIVGHSGAGKSTLIKMLLLEEKPSHGTILFEKFDVSRLRRRDVPKYRRRIGTVFQDFKLIANKTVFENVAFAMEAAGRTDEEIAADVPHVLNLVDLRKKIWNFPHELSGGEKQRVAIARAIINQPDIVVADEPTGNLDPVNAREIVEILKKINSLGTTVILTTHNKDVVDAIGKRVITMEKGKIIRDDKDGKYAL